MIAHINLSGSELRSMIRKKKIRFAGNRKLKIYGHLNCYSGKRMKAENRVFFLSEEEAKQAGYRACKKCVRHPLGSPRGSPVPPEGETSAGSRL